MDIPIESRGTFTGRGGHVLFACAKDSVKDFFAARPDITRIHLVALSAGRADVQHHLVKVKPTVPTGYNPSGVPVVIHTEGTQGLMCYMSIQGMSDAEVRELIERGPYRRNRKLKEAPKLLTSDSAIYAEPATPIEPVHDAVEPEPVVAEPTPPDEPPVVAPVPIVVKRVSPLEKLQATGTPEDEIDRLKTTMASIVYRQVGEGEIPNLLQVSVNDITDAILEHMKLPKNGANNYRGTIANFYSTRIALFALKWEDSIDPEARYEDWLVDVLLVLDFVGGRNNLSALTRDREQEIRERLAVERMVEENPPPTAESVEVAAVGGFVADAALLDLAMQSREGRLLAEEALQAARQNAESLAAEVVRIEAQLAAARQTHSGSLAMVAEAEEGLKKFVLTPKTVSIIRNAKTRLDALVADLGL